MTQQTEQKQFPEFRFWQIPASGQDPENRTWIAHDFACNTSLAQLKAALAYLLGRLSGMDSVRIASHSETEEGWETETWMCDENLSAGAWRQRKNHVVSGCFSNVALCVGNDCLAAAQENGVELMISGDKGQWKIQHDCSRFEASFANQLAGMLDRVLQAFEDDGQPLVEIEILGEIAQKECWEAPNQTFRELPQGETLLDQFAKVARENPDAPALLYKDQVISYAELDAKTNQLARYLLEENALATGDIVGVMADRSPYLVIGMLGILKAGGVYLPLNPEHAARRNTRMIREAGIKALLVHSNFFPELTEVLDIPMFALDFQLEALDHSADPLSVDLSPEDLAYIIYTSGSTGFPKGVMIPHQGILNVALDYSETFQIGVEDRVLQFFSRSFDAAVLDILMALVSGAGLVMIPEEVLHDKNAFLNYLEQHRVTLLSLTPSYLRSLDQAPLGQARVLITGGEAASPEDARHYAGQLAYYNAYGPCEGTVSTSLFRVPAGFSGTVVPIGRPRPNKRVYLLDAQGRLVPKGFAGELFLAGNGISLGYLNQAELTADRFQPDPFMTNGDRMYATGDLARWNADGELEFLGRKDDQLKIRGYRVEPGEIAALLREIPQLDEVMVRPFTAKQGETVLVAYYTAASPLAETVLQNRLADRLPAFMLPRFYMFLEAFPRTPNGKIDRNALPDPQPATEGSPHAEAENLDAQALEIKRIWETIFARENIMSGENFFDLGGHSLMAIQLVARINEALDLSLTFKDVLEFPTIAGLAELAKNGPQFEKLPLEPAPEAESYGLSRAQQRLWLMAQIEDQSLAYNLVDAFSLEGKPNHQALETALQALVQRHASLRTVFKNHEGSPRQVVLAEMPMQLGYVDLRDDADIQASVAAHTRQESARAFDLENGPLLRGKLLQTGEESAVLLLATHHIVSDGWSLTVLINDLANYYQAALGRTVPELEPLPLHYHDFAVWHNHLMETESMAVQANYWMERLGGELPVLDFPADAPRPAFKTFNGGSVHFQIDPALEKQLESFSRENGTTVFITYLTALKLLFSRYANQSDILLGTSIAGRNHPALDQQIGFFVNTLLLRTQLDPGAGYRDNLSRVRTTTLEAYANQDYPFDALVEHLDYARDLSRNPLVDFFVSWNEYEAEYQQALGPDIPSYVNRMPAPHYSSRFDLGIQFSPGPQGIHVEMEYNSDIYAHERIAQFARHFQAFLSVLVAQPDTPAISLPICSPAEIDDLRRLANSATPEVEAEVDLLAALARTFDRYADKTAICWKNERHTFGEIWEAARSKAAFLLENFQVRTDEVIGLSAGRNVHTAINQLAILMTGAAFMPVDPELPAARRNFQLEDSACRLFISDTAESDLPETVIPVVFSDLSAVTEFEPQPGKIAYLLYTSGSTGQPKGALIGRDGFVKMLQASIEIMELSSNDHLLQFFRFSFDAAQYLLFSGLLSGATTLLLSEAETEQPESMPVLLEQHEITVAAFPPAYLAQINIADFEGLRMMITGGEAARPALIQSLLRAGISYLNLYGLTETTCNNLFEHIRPGDALPTNIPLGQPVASAEVLLLDAHLQLVPTGVTGEICIGGPGVMLGYQNRAEAEAKHLVDHPFVAGQKIFRTGDLGRYNLEGKVEYLGRKDHQVKIRGQRVEPGEIKQILESHAEVKMAQVILRRMPDGEEALVAYLVGSIEKTEVLRSFLAAILPTYMIPNYFEMVDEIPLTANGKIDLDRLPLPESGPGKRQRIQPKNPTEAAMLRIWQDIFSKQEIGTHENFFDLGGHSLLAMKIRFLVTREFGVELNLKEIFQNPTIFSLSQLIRRQAQPQFAHIPAVAEQAYYPASHAQERLWVLSHLKEQSAAYNMSIVLDFPPETDGEDILAAWATVVGRHEALRTSFEENDGKCVQIIHPAVNYRVAETPVSNREEVADVLADLLKGSFDLTEAPLFRAAIVPNSAGRTHYLLVLHHIVADGWSLGLLREEMEQELNSIQNRKSSELPALPTRYVDYAAWQKTQLRSEKGQKDRAYWLNQFANTIPVLNLPMDRSRPALQTFAGNSYHFQLSEGLSAQLRTFARTHRCSLFALLTTLVKTQIFRYTGESDLILGTPMAGRPHQDVENVVGMFVNTLPLRTQLDGALGLEANLHKVSETVMAANSHAEYPFDLLVEELKLPRDLSRHPLFDLVISWNQADGTDRPDILPRNAHSKFDLVFHLEDDLKQVNVILEYNRDLFQPDRIERMGQHLETLASAAMDDPAAPLARLNMLPAAEATLLRSTFNATAAKYPAELTLHQRFEAMAERFATRKALVAGTDELSYAELNARANQCAHALLEKHQVQPGDRVAVLLPPGWAAIVGMLGILKAGGTYVPVDVTYPAAKIEFMLTDAAAQVVISEAQFLEGLTMETVPAMLCLGMECLQVWPQHNPELQIAPTEAAYIIYTSGTTGKSKGCRVSHRNVIRLLINEQLQFDFSEQDTWIMAHSYCFDFSVWEMYGALLYGGTLVVPSRETIRDTWQFLACVEQHQVSVLNQTPGAFYNFVEVALERDQPAHIAEHLRYVIFGGDKLDPGKLQNWIGEIPVEEVALINMYGITETTVHVTFHALSAAEIRGEAGRSTIGVPIPETQVYVLDAEMQLSPIGVAGEMYVGGSGVSLGYLNREILNRERFISNPFQAGEKLYRTGDLGRWNAEGKLEYLGRNDHQVKIRGHRIEPGEIEYLMLQTEMVKECLVSPFQPEGADALILVAYYVAVSGQELSENSLRKTLSGLMPDYMIPTSFVSIPGFLLNHNGKIDRNALPAPQIQVESSSEAAVGPLENALAQIWVENLKVEAVGRKDNYFNLGGDSIKAIRLISTIRKRMQLELNLSDLFLHPRLDELAAHLASQDQEETTDESADAFAEFRTRILNNPEMKALLPADWEDFYPMADIQQGMVFHNLLDVSDHLYHDQFCFKFEDEAFDLARFRQAFAQMAERHEILRTSFHLHKFSEPLQIVHKQTSVKVEWEDWMAFGEEDLTARLENLLAADREVAFDLEQAGIFRLKVLATGPGKYHLVLVFHHAVMDGWSFVSFISEWIRLYKLLATEPHLTLPKLQSSNRDFVAEERAWQANSVALSWWAEYLETWQAAPLPLHRQKQNTGSPIYRHTLPEHLRVGAKDLAQQLGLPVKHIFLAACAMLVHRTTDASDFCIGLVNSSRPTQVDGDSILGCFLNTLPFRVQIENATSWKQFLEGIDANFRSLKAHEKVPLRSIRTAVNALSEGENGLFDVVFNYIDFREHEAGLDDFGLEEAETGAFLRTDTAFDLTLSNSEAGLEVVIACDAAYDTATLARLLGYFEAILTQILNQPETDFSALSLPDAAEVEALLAMGTGSPAPAALDFGARLSALAEARPRDIAVTAPDGSLTYTEIRAQSDRIARWLDQNPGEGGPIGLLMTREKASLPAILGALQAGVPYLPIDPDLPKARIRQMLESAGCTCVLHQNSSLVLDQVNMQKIADLEPGQASRKEVDPDGLAYIIFTSGTTGRAKGAKIRRHGLQTMVAAMQNILQMDASDGLLQFFSWGFDVSHFNHLLALAAGATLVIPDEDICNDKIALPAWCRAQAVTCAGFGPAFLKTLEAGAFSFLKILFTGGEGIAGQNLKAQMGPDTQYFNMYGLTESTCNSLCYGATKSALPDGVLPLGLPVPGTQAHIVDRYAQLAPTGMRGELILGGDRIAVGYVGNSAHHAARFLQADFSSENLLRTGDIVDRDQLGQLHFRSRVDDQLNFHGHRIEPGEIEFHLQNVAGVRQALARVVDAGKGNARLLAWVAGEVTLTSTAILAQLEAQLPTYMLPSQVMVVDEFPRTPNGKIDLPALREQTPQPQAQGAQFEAPATPAETLLAAHWAALLGLDQVGRHDHFFRRGGDSIKAIQLSARLRQAGYSLKVKALFGAPTLREQASLLEKIADGSDTSQKQVGAFPLTPIQHWFAELTREVPHTRAIFNQAMLLETAQTVDSSQLQQVLQGIVDSHGALRTAFSNGENGALEARILEKGAPFDLEVHDLSGAANFDDSLLEIAQNLQNSFDLEQPPLLKAALIQSESENFILLVAHHLVVDGVSWRILRDGLTEGLATLRKGETLHPPATTDSFISWAEWNAAEAQRLDGTAVSELWLSYLAREIDLFAPEMQALDNKMGDIVSEEVELSEALTRGLLHEMGPGMELHLLSALQSALREWQGLENVLIQMERHGRDELPEGMEMASTIGWFTSMFPLLLENPAGVSLAQRLRRIKQELKIAANASQAYGWQRYTNQHAELARLQPQISFNYLGRFGVEKGEHGLRMAEKELGDNYHPELPREFLLDVVSMVRNGKLFLQLIYSKSHFSSARIQELLGQLQAALEAHQAELKRQKINWTVPAEFALSAFDLPAWDELFLQLNREPAEIRAVYPLSPMQEGMLFQATIDRGERQQYFQQVSFSITGNLVLEHFRKAWELLQVRHDILRTVFIWRKIPHPVQVVLEAPKLDFRVVSPELAETLRARDAQEAFVLEAAPPVRISVTQVAADRWEVSWSFHHILLDGWCTNVLFGELMTTYEALSREEEPVLPSPYVFRDYIAWLEDQDAAAASRFWENYLGGIDTATTIPFRKDRLSDAPYAVRNSDFRLGVSQSQKLYALAAEWGITVNAFVQSIWGLFLARYHDTETAIFGTITAGRPAELEGIEQAVGLFINTVPFRVNVHREQSIRSVMEETQAHLANLDTAQHIPLSEIQKLSELRQDLFDHILVFENYPIDENLMEDLFESGNYGFRMEGVDISELPSFDLNLNIFPHEDMQFLFTWNEHVMAPGALERIWKQLSYLIDQVLNQPELPVAELELEPAEVREALARKLNPAPTEFPNAGLASLFAETAAAHPEAIALVTGDEKISYARLNARANRLAHHLLENYDLQAGQPIGLMLPRSAEMIVAMLAVLKAGCAYVPLDAGHPADRTRFICADTGLKIMLTNSDHMMEFLEQGLELFVMDIQESGLETAETNPDRPSTGDDLAYIMYTSGTTGQPKGILTRQAGVVRLVRATNYTEPKVGDRILQLSNYAFDGSTFDIYGALLNGASLYLVEKAALLSMTVLGEFIRQNHINMTFITTALFNQLVDEDASLMGQFDKVYFGGQEASLAHVRKAIRQRKHAEALVHVYGPTEATTFATFHAVGDLAVDATNLPIGRGISNTEVLVLDQALRVVPQGIEGEICLSGPGLANGYLNRPELTAAKFVPHPLREGELIYRTGDLGRWNEKGELEFRGRRDTQVKIRGFRIELGEVENALLEHRAVRQVFVMATEAKAATGSRELAAYLVSETGTDISVDSLREYLQEKLPFYMIPAHFVQLEALPLNSNGKVDRSQLPDPEAERLELGSTYAAARNEDEALLLQLIGELLGREQVGIHDNYFSLGGDSIKAIQLVARLNLHEKDLDVRDLFEYPVIGDMAAHIKDRTVSIDQGKVVGAIPLTPVQAWFFKHYGTFEAAREGLHQMVMLSSTERLDQEMLEKTFGALIAHHDVLRMRYRHDGGNWEQFNEGEAAELQIEVISLDDPADIEGHTARMRKRIDIQAGRMISVGLFRLADSDRLFIAIHHLVVDGVSWRILLDDLTTLYTQIESGTSPVLQAKTLSFRDWSTHLSGLCDGKMLAESRAYWHALSQKQNELTDPHPEVANLASEAAEYTFSLPAETTRQLLTDAHSAYHTGMNDLLLTGLAMAFRSWKGTEELLVTMEGHGREIGVGDLNISRTIGWFTSLYPVALKIGEYADTGRNIREIKENLRAIPDHGFSYGLHRWMVPDAQRITGPEAPVAFNYLGRFDRDFEASRFQMATEKVGGTDKGKVLRPHLLEVNCVVEVDQLRLVIQYHPGKHTPTEIASLARAYQTALETIVNHCLGLEESVLSPSDIDYDGLSIDALDNLLDILNEG